MCNPIVHKTSAAEFVQIRKETEPLPISCLFMCPVMKLCNCYRVDVYFPFLLKKQIQPIGVIKEGYAE